MKKQIIYTAIIFLSLGLGSYYAVKTIRKAIDFKKGHQRNG